MEVDCRCQNITSVITFDSQRSVYPGTDLSCLASSAHMERMARRVKRDSPRRERYTTREKSDTANRGG